MSGWASIHRGIRDHWLWDDKPFTKGQAWIDLIISANHKAAKIVIKSQIVSLNRGDQARSEVTLAKCWGWSRGKVRRFLSALENESMIVQQKTQLTSIISICNYSIYQSGDKSGNTANGTADSTAGDTADGQQTDSRRYTDNNVNNENNEDNENNKPEPKPSALGDAYPLFEYWREVMRKGSSTKPTKGRMAKINARLKEGYTVDQIKAAIDGCARSPYHMGVNDQGRKYDDLDLICRSGEKLEGFVTINEQPIQQGLTVKDHSRQAQIEARNRELGISTHQGDFIEGESVRHD